MKCANPYKIYPKTEMFRYDHSLYLKKYPLGYFEVPCGQCTTCRIARAREWSLRLSHESYYWKDSTFLTLTYSDEHLPKNNSLDKSALQKLFKRMRKSGLKFRYYACGEYGQRFTKRPHYHAIIFGLRADFDFKKYWTYGNIFTGSVTPDSCRYVAQYIDKKYYGDLAEEVYTSKGLVIPFQLASQQLGLRYALEDEERIRKNLVIHFEGNEVGIPRYYKKKLGMDTVLFEHQAHEKLFDVYSHYDRLDYSLNEAKAAIAKARWQNNNTLKTRLSHASMKRLQLDKTL